MLFLPYFLLRLFRRISSQISAPSKLPIVTLNMSNRSDFQQCMIMSMSLSLIVVQLANQIALGRRDSVMDV